LGGKDLFQVNQAITIKLGARQACCRSPVCRIGESEENFSRPIVIPHIQETALPASSYFGNSLDHPHLACVGIENFQFPTPFSENDSRIGKEVESPDHIPLPQENFVLELGWGGVRHERKH